MSGRGESYPLGSTYILDIDVILNGSARRLVKQGELRGKIVVHKAIIEYLYKEARMGRSTGVTGLEELKKLIDEAKGLEVSIVEEERPLKDLTLDDVKRLVRDYAWKMGGVLVSSDDLLLKSAEAMGISTLHVGTKTNGRLKIEEFFDEKTMSVHLKENAPPLAKIGRPGRWLFVSLSDRPLTRSEIEEMAREIIEVASRMESGFVEIDRSGSTIVQLKDYRIVITRPPLSDGWEITAVRPVVKLSIEDYNIPEKLMKRFIEKAEGILIAGAPGMGKTTFAQALAEFYARQGKVVKTIESPRDMRLPPIVTQYSKNYADLGELHDILLLSRPDYTVFDELRTDEDFKLYVDLRLAGIGMIGVVHATSPIDAIQRFIRRVELGMIPSIIDTVIFINEGRIDKVYELSMTVKLPTGLKEAELSRPVVEVRDFLSGELEYEIYTFGEQTMVVPVKQRKEAKEMKIVSAVKKLLPGSEVNVDGSTLVIKVSRANPKLTARRLKRIRRLAEKYGLETRIIPE
jgi:ATPase